MPKTGPGYHVDRRAPSGFCRYARVMLAAVLTACGTTSVPSPFYSESDAGTDASGMPDQEGGSPSSPDGAFTGDPGLGGPCDRDSDCDDGLECTADECVGALLRCRFVPDPSVCQDGIFCNGAEVCVPGVGCRSAESDPCSDGQPCTIESCDEKRRACDSAPRDADGDGDADANCPGGTDCADDDPLISGTAVEVCDNGRDDDCDGDRDEEPCEAPQFDTCATALEVSGDGRFQLDPSAAALDYGASCAEEAATLRDLVIAVEVPDGSPVDVDLTATARNGDLALAHLEACGDPSSEAACAAPARNTDGDSVARLRLRSISPGAHAVLLFTRSAAEVVLDVRYEAASQRPANETCGTAAALAAGVKAQGRLIDAARDLDTRCEAALGEQVYVFELDEPQDVRLFAASSDGVGQVSASLQGPACETGEAAELTCRIGEATELFARALQAGKYFVGVSATAPTDYDLLLETELPTSAAPDEACPSGVSLTFGKSLTVDLAGHTDDVQDGCLSGAPDAAFDLDVPAPSDILLVQRLADGDEGAISLRDAQCADSPIVCTVSPSSPVRAVRHGVRPGQYSVVVESALGNPVTVVPFSRPARAPVVVPFADDCEAAVPVPPEGGFFQGNTANASSDYEAGCDAGGLSERGAAEQMLRLVLTERRRVVLDTRGSDFATLLDVRRGPRCPGEEIPRGCSAGFGPDRSFVDVVLDPGEYFIQVDGYAGAQGAWWLDVFVADP